MSNLADTSLAAFRALDVTAQQARVLSAFTPGAQHTRQELVQLTGMPINAICGRCKELLDAGALESLPAVGGRHPLRLKNAAGQRGLDRLNALPSQEGRAASVASAASLVAVRPTLFGRQSMSLATAKKIVPDKGNAFLVEALAVVANGGSYWIWS